MKKEFSIVLLFSRSSPFVHECSANFRSLFAHFLWFFVKTTRNRNFSLKKIVIFCHFEYFSTFLVQNSVGGGLSIFGHFWPILMSTPLNMTSYRVTEAINGYF